MAKISRRRVMPAFYCGQGWAATRRDWPAPPTELRKYPGSWRSDRRRSRLGGSRCKTRFVASFDVAA
jgi:hypothetical protein